MLTASAAYSMMRQKGAANRTEATVTSGEK